MPDYKWSPGCGCCEAEGPCCVEAKRYFMDNEGHSKLVITGSTGGPYTNYYAADNACTGRAYMSNVDVPAWSLSTAVELPLVRNDDNCSYYLLTKVCPPTNSHWVDHTVGIPEGLFGSSIYYTPGDYWDIGNGSSCSGLFGTVFIGMAQNIIGEECEVEDYINGGTVDVQPLIYGLCSIGYYCDGSAYKYRLDLTSFWRMGGRGPLASLRPIFDSMFPSVDGTNYTTNYSSTRLVNGYTETSGNGTVVAELSEVPAASRSYIGGITANDFLIGTTSSAPKTLTMWVPNSSIDPLGITDAFTVEIQ